MLGLSIGLPFGTRLVTSIAASAPYVLDGVIRLQADDGSWHDVSLVTDGGTVTTSVNQSAAADPGASYLGYLALFEPVTEHSFRIALAHDGANYTISIDQTVRSESIIGTQLLNNSTDGLNYLISIILDGANVTLVVDQSPS